MFVSGRVINLSPVGPVPYQAGYSMISNAVDAFTNILRDEMKRFEVRVIKIQAGNDTTTILNVRILKWRIPFK